MSMLPAQNKHAISGGGNNHTNNSFSDKHSMVSGTAPGNLEPSEIEFLSMGGPPSEAGSLFDTSLNAAVACDERRELELAYKDLYH